MPRTNKHKKGGNKKNVVSNFDINDDFLVKYMFLFNVFGMIVENIKQNFIEKDIESYYVKDEEGQELERNEGYYLDMCNNVMVLSELDEELDRQLIPKIEFLLDKSGKREQLVSQSIEMTKEKGEEYVKTFFGDEDGLRMDHALENLKKRAIMLITAIDNHIKHIK
jgi:hypothetical protein